MMKLEDYRPAPHEWAELKKLGIADAEQVAIGYVRARRKDQMSKRKKP